MIAFAIDAIFVGILVCASIYDIRYFILPDGYTLALVALGGLSTIMTATVHPVDAVMGAALGGSLLLAARAMFGRLRNAEGLGLGDVKWLAAGGLWVGWSGIGPVVLVATVGGLIAFAVHVARTRRFDPLMPIPFGPFLSFGIAFVHFMARWHEGSAAF